MILSVCMNAFYMSCYDCVLFTHKFWGSSDLRLLQYRHFQFACHVCFVAPVSTLTCPENAPFFGILSVKSSGLARRGHLAQHIQHPQLTQNSNVH